RSIAQRFVDKRPDYAAVLVDLRAHGESRTESPPDTLAQCAADLEAIGLSIPVEAVLGHSFGGKVALAYAMARPCSTFVVDSTPSARPNKSGSESVLAVLHALRALPPSFDDRRAFVRALNENHSIPRPTAMWLAMNLEKDGDRMVFGVDLDRIDALLADYFEQDLWAAVGANTTFLLGGKSDVVSKSDIARAQSAGATTLTFEDAAHWVHVDAPEALTDALVEHAPK
ncbi:MAG: esterase, partial [Polyangiales bacterium]